MNETDKQCYVSLGALSMNYIYIIYEMHLFTEQMTIFLRKKRYCCNMVKHLDYAGLFDCRSASTGPNVALVPKARPANPKC